MNSQSSKGKVLSWWIKGVWDHTQAPGTGSWGFKIPLGIQGHIGHNPLLQGYSIPWDRAVTDLKNSRYLVFYDIITPKFICSFSMTDIWIISDFYEYRHCCYEKPYASCMMHKNKSFQGICQEWNCWIIRYAKFFTKCDVFNCFNFLLTDGYKMVFIVPVICNCLITNKVDHHFVYLFFWMLWVLVAASGLSLDAEWGLLQLLCTGSSFAALGLSSWDVWV